MRSEKKSIGKNAFLNGFKSCLNLIFPLITFPYISKVLSVEEIGKYNFAQATISYFLLIAGLGISSYAIREGSKYRGEKDKFNKFATEVFFCNIVSTLIAYIFFVVCMFFVEKFKQYSILMVLFSTQVLFTTIGVEWIYSIYEEYEYITLRSIVFKILSIILIFVFVRKENDVNAYAAITVFASVGSNLLNLIHSKNFFKITKIKVEDCLKHIKPILIIFASNIAIMIYVYSDTTMLGFMTSDYDVGIYSVAVKIYNIVKNLLSSILIVSIPRLSMYYGNKMKTNFEITLQKVFDSLTTLILPAVIGLFCVSRQVILIISNKSYISGVPDLQILCVALFFCIYGWFFSQCILMPANAEKIILVATSISAIVNIGVNFILIPIWRSKAAAFTTVIAEFLMFFICGFYASKIVKIKVWTRNTLSVIVGCVLIILVCKIIPLFYCDMVLIQFLVIAFLSIMIYVIVLIAFHNTVAFNILNTTLQLYKGHSF